MMINTIPDSDISLVELADDGAIGRLTPHCKKHRAMSKVSANGYWRCVTTVATGSDNNCRAGCEFKIKRLTK